MKKLFIYSFLLVALASYAGEKAASPDTEKTVLPQLHEDVSEQAQLHADANAAEPQIKEEKKVVGNADEYKPVMLYADYLYLNNGAYKNINPTFMKDVPLNQMASLQVSYGIGKGDFHKVDKSGDIRDLIVDVYGIKKIDDVSFEGAMSYRNGAENSRRLNSSIYQSPLNPFILADTVFSDYTIEQFSIDGRFSWEPIDLLRFGVNASYQVGTTSDEQDPRLKADGMLFTINPGIDFKVSKYLKIGATGGIRLLSESLDYVVADNVNKHNLFLMKGFGLYYLGEATDDRKTKGLAWFASLQLYLNKPGYTNMLSGGIERNKEKADDGDKMFVGGEFLNTKIFASDRFSFTKGKFAHNFELSGEYNDVDGIWYDQQYISAGTQHWETKFKSIIYKHKLWQAQLSYRFDILGATKAPTFTLAATADYTNSKADNYPDGYTMKYQNIVAKLMLAKHFGIKKSILSLSVGGSYTKNLENNIFVDDNIKLKGMYTEPMFNYNIADYYSVNGKIETKIPIITKRFTSFIGIFVQASTQQYVGDAQMYKSTSFNQYSGGINYTF